MQNFTRWMTFASLCEFPSPKVDEMGAVTIT